MAQLLALINKGDRNKPAVYQFGKNERLNVHFENEYADLTNATTGAYIRYIGWDGLREMGYSPAKLLDGNTLDQRLTLSERSSTAKKALCYFNHILAGSVIAAALFVIGNTSGCNRFVTTQLDQDIATSTIYKETQDVSNQRSEFQKQARYANQKLAEMKLYAQGDMQ